jgi:hypothetical protein
VIVVLTALMLEPGLSAFEHEQVTILVQADVGSEIAENMLSPFGLALEHFMIPTKLTAKFGG